MNSKESSGLVSAAEGDGVDFVSISWCLASLGRARVSRGLRGLGHSSSEPSGVLGISALEQADVLVREGVGEHDRGGDQSGVPCGRWGVLDAPDVSLTSEAGSDEGLSIIISNALRDVN